MANNEVSQQSMPDFGIVMPSGQSYTNACSVEHGAPASCDDTGHCAEALPCHSKPTLGGSRVRRNALPRHRF